MADVIKVHANTATNASANALANTLDLDFYFTCFSEVSKFMKSSSKRKIILSTPNHYACQRSNSFISLPHYAQQPRKSQIFLPVYRFCGHFVGGQLMIQARL